MFSSAFTSNQPPNLHLLPSFTSQDLSPDGVFLNPISGLHYLIHLFDRTEAALSIADLGDKDRLDLALEGVRQHDDRLAYIENRHVHLQTRVNLKAAIDSEFSDWMLNKSEEDWLVFRRIKRLPKMSSSDWQAAARQQITDLIQMVLNINRIRLDFEVRLVVK